VLIGLTENSLMAFEKISGKTAWQVPGQYSENAPSTAVSGRVLYFQGDTGARPADQAQGRTAYIGGKLNALDLDTREILWSFSRPTSEPNWSFGFVTPVDKGLWVDSYQALVKLQ
jgi:outer membrane protein assembly factor BamB